MAADDNRIYLGEIVHKEKGYAGEHQPIISMELWDCVQQALADRSQGGTTRSPAKWPSLLIGMVVDGENRPMSPSHANKGQNVTAIISQGMSNWTAHQPGGCQRTT